MSIAAVEQSHDLIQQGEELSLMLHCSVLWSISAHTVSWEGCHGARIAEIESMLRHSIIVNIESTSPILMVPKPDGSISLCKNF